MSTSLLRIPVGVVVERRKANSPWADLLWRPVAVFAGLPNAAAWTPLAYHENTVTYYAGAAEIELYRSEADNYRRNLAMDAPSIWVALQATGGEPPYEIAAVTADPAEGEGLTEPGQAIVEAVVMPELVRKSERMTSWSRQGNPRSIQFAKFRQSNEPERARQGCTMVAS